MRYREIAGDTTLLLAIVAVFYFGLEMAGFPIIVLQYNYVNQISNAHTVCIFILGVWIALYAAMLLIRRLLHYD